jgi:hypothetical protein
MSAHRDAWQLLQVIQPPGKHVLVARAADGAFLSVAQLALEIKDITRVAIKLLREQL